MGLFSFWSSPPLIHPLKFQPPTQPSHTNKDTQIHRYTNIQIHKNILSQKISWLLEKVPVKKWSFVLTSSNIKFLLHWSFTELKRTISGGHKNAICFYWRRLFSVKIVCFPASIDTFDHINLYHVSFNSSEKRRKYFHMSVSESWDNWIWQEVVIVFPSFGLSMGNFL